MENELYHFGINGLKWGIRRYKNSDGSYTKAGKKRRREEHPDYTNAHTKKHIREMSNEELKSRNNRLQLEKTYEGLTKDQHIIGRGMKYVGTATAITGSALALYSNADRIISIGKKAAKRTLR